jgi:hypothetical protein
MGTRLYGQYQCNQVVSGLNNSPIGASPLKDLAEETDFESKARIRFALDPSQAQDEPFTR